MDFFRPAEDAECVLPPRGQQAQAGGKRRKTYKAKRRAAGKTRNRRR